MTATASVSADERVIRDAIDRDPSDGLPWAVYADWLDERDDPRADGMRAIGRVGWRPFASSGPGLYIWWLEGRAVAPDDLPLDLFDLLTGELPTCWTKAGRYYPSRWAAYDALALAWGRLPEERRAEILEGKP